MNEPKAEPSAPSVRSVEHAEARKKRITGSRIATIMGGTPAGWDTLSELLHNADPEKFYQLENTPNMPEQLKRGQEYEGMARGEFFFDHPEFEVNEPTFLVPTGDFGDPYIQDWIGISPDCKLLPAGGVEFKVPSMEKHLEWIEAGTVPKEHLPQCALSMLVTGEDWYFRSFCPEIPDGDPKRTFEVLLKVEDNQVYLNMMTEKLHLFLQGHLSYKVFSIVDTKAVEKSSPDFPVINFGVNDRAIAVLVDKYDKFEAPKNSSEYAVVAAAHKDMVKRRTGAESAYKKATDAAKKYISGAMAEKKRLWGLMEATEKRLKDMRTAWEDEQERIKAEKEAEIKAEEEKEATRVQECKDAIDIINNMNRTLGGLTSGEIELRIERFQAIPVTKEIFMEFLPDAENAKTALIARAKEVLETVLAEEKQAAEDRNTARVSAIKDRISDIRKWDAGLHAQSLTEIRAQLSAYKTYTIVKAGDYEDFADEAQQALDELIERTVNLLAEKEQQEDTRLENEELKRQLAEAEAEKSAREELLKTDTDLVDAKEPAKEHPLTADPDAVEAEEIVKGGPLMSHDVEHPVEVLVTCQYLVTVPAMACRGNSEEEIMDIAEYMVATNKKGTTEIVTKNLSSEIHEPTE